MSLTCNDSTERIQKLNIENGDSFSHPELLKYKRRKVSVVRDFPPGCGRSLLQNTSTVTKGVIGDIIESPPSVHHEVLGSVEMPNANTTLEATIKRTNISCLEDGHKTANVESSLLNEDLEGKDESFKNIKNSIGDEPSLKDLHGVVVSGIGEEVLEPSKSRPCSPPDGTTFVSNGKDVKEVVVRKYPPRRKVSAIRDFPPFCGQNAPPLSKEKGSLVIVSQNNFEHQYKLSKLDKDDECVGDNARKEECNIELVEDVTKLTVDKICTDVMVEPIKATKMDDKCGSKNKCTSERTKTSCSDQFKFDKKRKSTLNEVKETMEKEIEVYTREVPSEENISNIPSRQNQLKLVPCEQTLAAERPVVLGLMASSTCPWRQGKLNLKPSPGGGSNGKKVKKRDLRQLEKTKSILKEDGKEYQKNSSKTSIVEKDVNGDMHQLVVAGSMDTSINVDENNNSHVNYRSNNTNVSLIPFSQINESGSEQGSDSKGTRTRVRETLRLFHAVCRKLLQEDEAGKKVQGSAPRRIDFIAAKILKDKGKYVNVCKQILGQVPGVEVGDEFRYRIELNIIGLHRQTQGGIDYVKCGQKILATSIVASGGYANNLDNSDVLIYTGQGGNMMHSDKKPEDQKLERGNLALKNSFDEKSPVRVIRGSESSDGRTYVYDGLYLVEKWWQDMGPHGKLIFKFQLCRIPGQPELAWKEIKRSKKFKVREGLCVDDISQGKESAPICAVNIIDNEKPPPFNYITKMIYPDWCRPLPLKGCDCTDGCSDSERCYCAVLNGGEIPFNHNGAIVEAKTLVYECGLSCKCPPSCHNRVSQHGIKFQLEIFKTKSRGWGVRSLNSIPSGSFICEYIGELLEDKEAEQRTGNDEYLFDIGNNYSDNSLWDGLSTLLPDAQANACDIMEDGSFTIDAASYGNIGRFINHSCTPNLYAQNVLYDHEDKRIPHIMFFAAENIPPLQELSYHYNYMMDQVRDSEGNIKKKRCYCGSAECTGWMY
ncbi:histone-lysine N-methyltransferase, H3 lysine-9 specific SUVH6-like [Cucumis melo var. makuwa]|uniref:Histone-lysine N-methyltransferase, H3 lysine-9 specific SUVH6-like n=2 Tax=Cucumis melo TaxID=3656 RepID=A0A5A7TIA8_CUCMM|nr:histone-lysine N-methyltransferase, H3 lysine-9 specific SUVH6-like [Cucumis melo var. makuwa]TYK12059.1 histone-lysine N-methyltransferase, H3 lysine-9 specific SUVH6-like [Cucumis melo var. makuwa]